MYHSLPVTGHLRDPPLQPVGCCLYWTGCWCFVCVLHVWCPGLSSVKISTHSMSCHKCSVYWSYQNISKYHFALYVLLLLVSRPASVCLGAWKWRNQARVLKRNNFRVTRVSVKNVFCAALLCVGYAVTEPSCYHGVVFLPAVVEEESVTGAHVGNTEVMSWQSTRAQYPL